MQTKVDPPEGNPATKPAPAPTGPGPSPRPQPSGSGILGNFFIVIIVLGLAGGGVWWWRQRNPTAGAAPGAEAKGPSGAAGSRPPAPPVPVVTAKVAQKDFPIYLDGLGTVQAYNSVTVRVRVDGQLTKVAFTEGQDVKEGDLLAQIDPDPYRTQVEQAEGRKAQDEAQLINARVQLKRNSDLLAAKILAQQDYDTAKALVDQFEAAVKADQAAIDSAKVQLNYTRVLAPLSGRTGLRQVDQGNIVHANDANGLVVIAQLQPISVTFTLPEQTLNDIQKQKAQGELAVLAMARDNTSELGQGKLTVIDNLIDTTTGTIRLKATFPNSDLRLWPGQFVNSRLLLTTRSNAIVVPATVVQRGPDGTYAFVVNLEDSTVKVRPLKVGVMAGDEALIESGLQAGETVVVDGQYKLQSGAKILTGPPAGKPPGAKGGGGPGGSGPGGEKRAKTPKQ